MPNMKDMKWLQRREKQLLAELSRVRKSIEEYGKPDVSPVDDVPCVDCSTDEVKEEKPKKKKSKKKDKDGEE